MNYILCQHLVDMMNITPNYLMYQLEFTKKNNKTVIRHLLEESIANRTSEIAGKSVPIPCIEFVFITRLNTHRLTSICGETSNSENGLSRRYYENRSAFYISRTTTFSGEKYLRPTVRS